MAARIIFTNYELQKMEQNRFDEILTISMKEMRIIKWMAKM